MPFTTTAAAASSRPLCRSRRSRRPPPPPPPPPLALPPAGAAGQGHRPRRPPPPPLLRPLRGPPPRLGRRPDTRREGRGRGRRGGAGGGRAADPASPAQSSEGRGGLAPSLSARPDGSPARGDAARVPGDRTGVKMGIRGGWRECSDFAGFRRDVGLGRPTGTCAETTLPEVLSGRPRLCARALCRPARDGMRWEGGGAAWKAPGWAGQGPSSSAESHSVRRSRIRPHPAARE
ncbi:uncharacterized protein LOC142864083 [Microcebus murinus]|uniref:uncharacterized protein LOC142864083 n=1 Tax=Microcebus murinus TaxID=30608 RepID=UPI003F6BD5AA